MFSIEKAIKEITSSYIGYPDTESTRREVEDKITDYFSREGMNNLWVTVRPLADGTLEVYYGAAPEND